MTFPIKGAFIFAHRFTNKNFLPNPHLLKLTTIELIDEVQEPEIEQPMCIITTKQNWVFAVFVTKEELENAIKNSIFEPELHFKNYGI